MNAKKPQFTLSKQPKSTQENESIDKNSLIDEAIAEVWDEMGEGFEGLRVTQKEVLKQAYKDVYKTAILTGAGSIKPKLYNMILQERYGVTCFSVDSKISASEEAAEVAPSLEWMGKPSQGKA